MSWKGLPTDEPPIQRFAISVFHSQYRHVHFGTRIEWSNLAAAVEAGEQAGGCFRVQSYQKQRQ